jgi:replicative DNA helicase
LVINSLQDILAERMVMSALINNGADCFYDIANIVNENDFSKIENKILFSTIKNLYQEKSLK